MRAQAQFSILVDAEYYLLIKDEGPWDLHPTVTNDAEGVVARMLYRLNGRRLEYLDSEGERGVLVVEKGKFVGFAACEVKR